MTIFLFYIIQKISLKICIFFKYLLQNTSYTPMPMCQPDYITIQYSTVQYSIVQYSTVWYSTVQYSIVQDSIVITVRLAFLTHSVRMRHNFQGQPWFEFDGLGEDNY